MHGFSPGGDHLSATKFLFDLSRIECMDCKEHEEELLCCQLRIHYLYMCKTTACHTVRMLGSSGLLALRAVQDLKSDTDQSSQELRGASREYLCRISLRIRTGRSQSQEPQVLKAGSSFQDEFPSAL